MAGWLELPAMADQSGFFSETLWSGSKRNYTYLYDLNMYTSIWTAYPLYSATISGSNSSKWKFNPNIEEDLQINVKENSYGTNYGNSTYSRGHIVPDADRSGDATMISQAYYLTNQTPQIQNGFNGTIWNQLEQSIRSVAEATDTVYVVSGATFQTKDGNETVKYLTAAKSTIKPDKVPIPNYFWKVLLKVSREGDEITGASAIGIWFDHQAYSDNDWASHVCTVDKIEGYTGYDFFVNLPDDLETTAEQLNNWNNFSNFNK